MALWGQDKPALKRQGTTGEGWLRAPDGYKVVRITAAGETLHAKWVTVTDAVCHQGCSKAPERVPLLQHREKEQKMGYNDSWGLQCGFRGC